MLAVAGGHKRNNGDSSKETEVCEYICTRCCLPLRSVVLYNVIL